MDRKKLFKYLANLIFLILILNFLAQKFYWYFSIWWFDIAMHFLGGLWLGLSFIWIFSCKSKIEKIYPLFFLKTLTGVLFIGILWELFELYFINHLASNPFNIIDTFSDLFFDMVGGVLAISYFFKKIVINDTDEVK